MNAAALSPAVLLVGHPNVGKSVLFHRLTGAYVNVSNYPGTTVEVTRATARFDPRRRTARHAGRARPALAQRRRTRHHARPARRGPVRCLVQVGDAKNLRRTLTLTALLAELGVPMVLALNMHDEAAARGVTSTMPALAERTRHPGAGHRRHRRRGHRRKLTAPSARRSKAAASLLHYDPEFERHIAAVAAAITPALPHPHLAARGLAILFLGGDPGGRRTGWQRSRRTPPSWRNLRSEPEHRAGASCRPCSPASAPRPPTCCRRAVIQRAVRAARCSRSASARPWCIRCGACPSCSACCYAGL
jgi:ferrous iron transport protein B